MNEGKTKKEERKSTGYSHTWCILRDPTRITLAHMEALL
jgi:hypothetical protein